MNIRLIALVLVAFVAAGGAAMAANSWLSAQRAALAAAQTKTVRADHTRILVAKNALPAGTLIKEDMLQWQAWPDDGVSSTYLVEGKAQAKTLAGTVVRAGLAAGEPLTEARVVKPGDRGFLAAVLRPGFRAIAVQVNATSGIAGFVFPGDRVDLILSHSLGKSSRNARERLASETILTDIRVLAIDQTTDDQAEKAIPAKTVTLELTPKQVEMVTLISDLGRLSLSLRSLQPEDGTVTADEEGIENPVLARLLSSKTPERGTGHTLDNEVSRLLGGGPAGGQTRVRVVRGNESQTIEFGGR